MTEYQQLASVSGFVWVKGYIVGSTYRNINNAQFAAGSVDTNLLLAASDWGDFSVVPLELPQALCATHLTQDHPENLRFVAVKQRKPFVVRVEAPDDSRSWTMSTPGTTQMGLTSTIRKA